MRVAPATPAVLAVLVSVLAGCAPIRHHVAPYSDDAAAARELERRAVAYCRAVQPGGAAPPRPFRTDGCTCWWNDGWANCCVDHDVRYWCGGARRLRRAADAELLRCVAADHSKVVAFLMYLGTRLFGASWMPAHWRWGYGWRWPGAGPDAVAEVHARAVPIDGDATASESASTWGAAAVSRVEPP